MSFVMLGNFATIMGVQYILGHTSDGMSDAQVFGVMVVAFLIVMAVGVAVSYTHLCRGVGFRGSMTLMFRVGNVKNIVPSYQPNVKEIPYGAVNFFPLIREGEFRVEMTRYIGSETSAEDYTQGTIACRKQCGEVLQYLKDHWTGFEDAYLIDSAPVLGTICQPHLSGVQSMTKEMIMNQIVPEDRIAITAYGIDLHSPEVGGQNVLFYLEPEMCIRDRS